LINKVKAWLAEHEQSQGPLIVVDKLVRRIAALVFVGNFTELAKLAWLSG